MVHGCCRMAAMIIHHDVKWMGKNGPGVVNNEKGNKPAVPSILMIIEWR